MNTLLIIGLALCIGLLSTRIVKLIGLPFVTGYLVAGVIIGPYVTNLIQYTNLEDMSVIVNVALGFIAFSIGSSFKKSNLKKIGGGMFVITLFESLTAVALVTLVLWLIKVDLPIVFSLGAIAAATAPAATLMVVRQYKSKGIVTDTLLPVVALDDAVGLIVFSVFVSIAGVFATGKNADATQMVLYPLLEIVLSLAIGGALGFILSLISRFFKSRANRITAIIGTIFVGLGLVIVFDKYLDISLSALLLCMMIGAIYNNFFKECDKPLDVLDRWTHPLFMVFFVVSGANLNLKILPTVGVIGIAYILVRLVGKYVGATTGAAIIKADKKVVKYLGFTLFPQAGVAIGMAQIAVAELPPQYGSVINTVVLAATLVYELVGPLITKFALVKAGEIDKSTVKPIFGFRKKALVSAQGDGHIPHHATVHDVLAHILGTKNSHASQSSDTIDQQKPDTEEVAPETAVSEVVEQRATDDDTDNKA